MIWSTWIRVTHRWLSIAFTVGFVVNFIAWNTGKPPFWVVLLALAPLLLLLVSGLYMFALPYARAWRGARRPVEQA
jgi:hypothetical protein